MLVANRHDKVTEYTGGNRGGPIQQHSLSEQVTEFLFRELIHGRLKQGDRINEVLLAKNLGISRNPVREGLKRLEERGFLVTIPYRGTFVREFTIDDVDDVFEFRKEIEIFALKKALPRVTDADLALLGNAVANMLAAAENDDGESLVENDLRFHQLLVELGGNHRSLRSFRDLFSEICMLVAFVDHTFDSLHHAAADHIPILEALKSRDIKRSIAALDEHLDDAHRRLQGIYNNRAEMGTTA